MLTYAAAEMGERCGDGEGTEERDMDALEGEGGEILELDKEIWTQRLKTPRVRNSLSYSNM